MQYLLNTIFIASHMCKASYNLYTWKIYCHFLLNDNGYFWGRHSFKYLLFYYGNEKKSGKLWAYDRIWANIATNTFEARSTREQHHPLSNSWVTIKAGCCCYGFSKDVFSPHLKPHQFNSGHASDRGASELLRLPTASSISTRETIVCYWEMQKLKA